MVDRGDVYAENSSGPRTDPWDTPTEHEVTADEYEPITYRLCPAIWVRSDPRIGNTRDTKTARKSF